VLDLRHPGVRRILFLYAPVALGIGFSIAGTVLDRSLASGLGEAAISTQRFATTLIQFPLGLVAAAVSFAVLPTLSRQASAGDDDAFRTTLAMGMKVVLLLILPAAAGLAALAFPITASIFQRGKFDAADTATTARALLGRRLMGTDISDGHQSPALVYLAAVLPGQRPGCRRMTRS